jgi:hypothetical protein
MFKKMSSCSFRGQNLATPGLYKRGDPAINVLVTSDDNVMVPDVTPKAPSTQTAQGAMSSLRGSKAQQQQENKCVIA